MSMSNRDQSAILAETTKPRSAQGPLGLGDGPDGTNGLHYSGHASLKPFFTNCTGIKVRSVQLVRNFIVHLRMRLSMTSKLCYVLSFLWQASFTHGFHSVNRQQYLPLERNSISHGKVRLSSARAVSLSSSNIELNPLITDIKISKTVEVFSLVKQMEENGEKVTSLCVGEPDFAPPSAVLDATIQAVRQGKTTYTAVTGTAALRKAIAHDLRTRKGVSYDPSTEIVVGNGAKQCVFQVRSFCFRLLNYKLLDPKSHPTA